MEMRFTVHWKFKIKGSGQLCRMLLFLNRLIQLKKTQIKNLLRKVKVGCIYENKLGMEGRIQNKLGQHCIENKCQVKWNRKNNPLSYYCNWINNENQYFIIDKEILRGFFCSRLVYVGRGMLFWRLDHFFLVAWPSSHHDSVYCCNKRWLSELGIEYSVTISFYYLSPCPAWGALLSITFFFYFTPLLSFTNQSM